MNDRVGRPFFAFVRLPLSPFGSGRKLTDACTGTNARSVRESKLALLPSLSFAWLNTNLLTRGAFRRHVGATKFQTAPSWYLFSEIPTVKIFFMFFSWRTDAVIPPRFISDPTSVTRYYVYFTNSSELCLEYIISY